MNEKKKIIQVFSKLKKLITMFIDFSVLKNFEFSSDWKKLHCFISEDCLLKLHKMFAKESFFFFEWLIYYITIQVHYLWFVSCLVWNFVWLVSVMLWLLGQEVEGLDQSCGWCREPLQLGRIHWPWGKGQHTATCSSWQPPRHLATGLLYIEYISINNIGTHEERNTEKKACKGEGNH